jgi:hypothetical protein
LLKKLVAGLLAFTKQSHAKKNVEKCLSELYLAPYEAGLCSSYISTKATLNSNFFVSVSDVKCNNKVYCKSRPLVHVLVAAAAVRRLT